MSPDRPLPNTYWVIPGRLLAGEYPGGADFTDSRARLARLREAGINCFVDLTEEGELPAYRHLLPFNAKYRRCAILDMGVPNDFSEIARLIEYIQAELALGRGIYVHCRAGIGRTGLLIGCFLAQRGDDGPAALKELNNLWRQNERAKSWPAVPQTPRQAEYVREWPSRTKLIRDP